MCADDNEFVSQLWIGALEHCEYVTSRATGCMGVRHAGDGELLKIRPVGAGRLELEVGEASSNEVTGAAFLGRAGEATTECVVCKIAIAPVWPTVSFAASGHS
jgi:hypothetical protein